MKKNFAAILYEIIAKKSENLKSYSEVNPNKLIESRVRTADERNISENSRLVFQVWHLREKYL